MPKYNFKNLNPEEFESLAADVMSRVTGFPMLRFPAGPDGGIDLTESIKNHQIIVQCKRYQNTSTLISTMKGEAKKIFEMPVQPKDYYLFTSVELSAKNKKDILDLFPGLMKDERFIFDAIAIEEFFKQRENMDLVARHKKLFEAFPEGYLTDYKDSFQEYVDTWIPLIEIRETYHYRNNYLKCFGREKELKALQMFLQSEGHLRWMGVVGPGGMGKSKLLYSFIQSLQMDPQWKAIWIPFSDVYEVTNKNYSRWSYYKNLLIIIDYAGKEAENIGRWIMRMEKRLKVEDPDGKKVRIVLIEREDVKHQSSTVVLEPVWYKRLQSYGDQNQYINQLCYQITPHQPFLQIFGLAKQHNYTLVKEYLAKKRVILNDAQINEILMKAQQVDNEYDIPRPLFILLTIDAYLEKRDMVYWKYYDVMEYVLKRQERHWLESICRNNKDLLAALKQMLVFATACASWDSEVEVDEPFMQASRYLQSLGRKELNDIIQSVNKQGTHLQDDGNSIRLNPLEPDLIGEYFVLSELENVCGRVNLNRTVQTLWQKEKEFYEFLYRCCETYYDEKNFFYFFKNGFDLLKPENYGEDRYYLYARLLSYLAEKSTDRLQLRYINQNLEKICQAYPDDERIAQEYAKSLFCEDSDMSLETLRELYLGLKGTSFSIMYFEYIASIVGAQTEEEWTQFVGDLTPYLHEHQTENSYFVSYAEAVKARITVCRDEEKQTLLKGLLSYHTLYGNRSDLADTYLSVYRIAYAYGDEQTKSMVVKCVQKIHGKSVFQNASDRNLCQELLSYAKRPKESAVGKLKEWIKNLRKHDSASQNNQNPGKNQMNGVPVQVVIDTSESMAGATRPSIAAAKTEFYESLMAPTAKRKTIYLAYSQKEKDIVGKYAWLLGRNNYQILSDKDVPYGEDWNSQKAQRIERAEIVIFFISKNSISKNSFAMREVMYAFQLRKRILPIYLEDVALPEGLAYVLRSLSSNQSIRAFDYYNDNLDNDETVLAHRILEAIDGKNHAKNRERAKGELLIKEKDGTLHNVQIEIPESGCVIGRSTRADCYVYDNAISRMHFKIIKEDNEFYVEDLAGINGTYLNAMRLVTNGRMRLRNNDIIKAGLTEFRWKEISN